MIQIKSTMKGFTVIELLLAMTGIAFVLIFIVFAVMHATNLYTKGIAIRQINQAGRQITEDISQAIRYSTSPQIVSGKNRICAGGKAYIWNSDDVAWRNKDDTGKEVGFVIVDGVALCTAPAVNDIPSATAREAIGNVVKLQSITVSRPIATSAIYDVSVILSTSGSNEPNKSLVGGVTKYECDPVFGQYCAFGDFSTHVYARKGE